MMNKLDNYKDTKRIVTLVMLNLFYVIYLYLLLRIQYKNNLLIQLEAVHWRNIGNKLFFDVMTMLLFPSIIILYK